MQVRARPVVSTWAIALIAAACGGTAAPTESPTVVPATATPTVEPVATPTAVPTDTAAPGPTLIAYPGPPIPPGTLTVEIAALPHDLFDRRTMSAPADTPFVIAFDNRDVCATDACRQLVGGSGQQHNVAIRLGTDPLFNPLPTIVGPAKAKYFIPEGLSAGTYRFLCIVHPLMNGTLTVE